MPELGRHNVKSFQLMDIFLITPDEIILSVITDVTMYCSVFNFSFANY